MLPLPDVRGRSCCEWLADPVPCDVQADTVIDLTSSADDTVYGQDFTLTATIAAYAPSTAGGVPTGCAPPSACAAACFLCTALPSLPLMSSSYRRTP